MTTPTPALDTRLRAGHFSACSLGARAARLLVVASLTCACSTDVVIGNVLLGGPGGSSPGAGGAGEGASAVTTAPTSGSAGGEAGGGGMGGSGGSGGLGGGGGAAGGTSPDCPVDGPAEFPGAALVAECSDCHAAAGVDFLAGPDPYQTIKAYRSAIIDQPFIVPFPEDMSWLWLFPGSVTHPTTYANGTQAAVKDWLECEVHPPIAPCGNNHRGHVELTMGVPNHIVLGQGESRFTFTPKPVGGDSALELSDMTFSPAVGYLLRVHAPSLWVVRLPSPGAQPICVPDLSGALSAVNIGVVAPHPIAGEVILLDWSPGDHLAMTFENLDHAEL